MEIFLVIIFGLCISIGIKWILMIIFIPLMFLLTALGVHFDLNSDILSTRLSILAIILSVIYMFYGDKLIKSKKIEVESDIDETSVTPDDISVLTKASLTGSEKQKNAAVKLLSVLSPKGLTSKRNETKLAQAKSASIVKHSDPPQWAENLLNSLKQSMSEKVKKKQTSN